MGDPGVYNTDVGPVIDQACAGFIEGPSGKNATAGKTALSTTLDDSLRQGSFFPPSLVEISALSQLTQEVFGPVLHLIRYRASELDQVIDAVNATATA